MSRYVMCPVCGHRMTRARGNYGNGNDEFYVCNYCDGDDFDDGGDEEYGEMLSVQDAADIWRSRGMDEEYTFGHTEEELRKEQ